MWPPSIPKVPKSLEKLLGAIIGRIDDIEPRDGNGIKVADAAGGGKSVNLFGARNGATDAATKPFQLIPASDDTGAKVRILTSTLAGDTPDGFSEGDDPPYIFTGVADGTVFYGILTIDDETGEITSRTLAKGASLPDNTDTEFYVRIGSAAVTDGAAVPVNDRYGPIDAQICRDWFADPVSFGVTFIGS
jgi:hypothetical protein